MKKLFLTFGLVAGALLSINAQEQGDWYIGTGDLSNTAWTQWALTPTVGYAFTDDVMAGVSVNQGTTLNEDGEVVAGDLNLDVHARYFVDNYFVYVGTENLTTDFGLNVGVGMLLGTGVNGLYVDPKVVYNTNNGTTNLGIGFGFRF
jgi:hypothetical protein